MINGKEMRQAGRMSKKEISRQVNALQQYLEKFEPSEQKAELEKWLDSKDFDLIDAIEIVLMLVFERKWVIA